MRKIIFDALEIVLIILLLISSYMGFFFYWLFGSLLFWRGDYKVDFAVCDCNQCCNNAYDSALACKCAVQIYGGAVCENWTDRC